MLILKLQLTHNNAMIGAIMQSHACLLNMNLVKPKSKQLEVPKRPRIADTNATSSNEQQQLVSAKPPQHPLKQLLSVPLSGTASVSSTGGGIGLSKLSHSGARLRQFANSFVSIQMEKVHSHFL